MSSDILEHIVIDAGCLIKGHGFEFHKFAKVRCFRHPIHTNDYKFVHIID
jgi:hypothetical protein